MTSYSFKYSERKIQQCFVRIFYMKPSSPSGASSNTKFIKGWQVKRAFNLIRCGVVRAQHEKIHSNSLERYRQSIIHVQQFNTFRPNRIGITLPDRPRQNLTQSFRYLSLIWIVALWQIVRNGWMQSFSVLQHRTWYQTGIQINAISLKRLHVVNKIAGFRRRTEQRPMG